MTIDFTLEEIKAMARAAEWLLDIGGGPLTFEEVDDIDPALRTAWLKLVRAQAAGLAVPARSATLAGHSTPGVGTADKVVPAPIPGVTRMGAGTLSFDTWGLR